MSVFTISLVRHGETVANKKQILQGQQDVPLSDVGLRQAQLVAQRLQYERFTHIFSSDLNRASKTAQTIQACNQVGGCSSITYDARLRERKFGELEGKHIKELKEAAKRSNTAVGAYSPPGAESLEQLNHRAVSFFKELCHIVHQLSCSNSLGNSPSSKRRRCGDSERLSTSPDEIFSVDLHKTELDSQNADTINSNWDVTKADHSNSGSTSGCSSIDSTDTLSSSESNTSTVVDSVEVENYTPASIFKRNLFDTSELREIPGAQNINRGCPNVSLSPLLEHRFSSISSVSSGRNNSFDDADAFPVLLAEVLVVGHGGWLRQVVRHFIDDLDCRVPGGKGFALRTTPNTGISKFAVSLQEDSVQVTCILLHDKDHLNEMSASEMTEGLM